VHNLIEIVQNDRRLRAITVSMDGAGARKDTHFAEKNEQSSPYRILLQDDRNKSSWTSAARPGDMAGSAQGDGQA